MAFLEQILPWNRAEDRVTVSDRREDRADGVPENDGFMDEPSEATAGLDDSLASEVGDRVKEVVDDAERDAAAIRRESDIEARELLEAARAEAREIREDAERQAQVLAADRVHRILELRRHIDSHVEQLAAAADDPDAVKARVGTFLEALADRADVIAREIDTGEPRLAEDEPAPEAEPEAPRQAPSTDANGSAPRSEPALAAVAAGRSADPLHDARLGALRMAVAGTSRTELEAELGRTLDPRDTTAVLDDVFGRPRSPFPKWSEAVKRAG
jgi:hypothetical protein